MKTKTLIETARREASRLKGVTAIELPPVFAADIDGVPIGKFATAQEAALAHDREARRVYGDRALDHLNFSATGTLVL